MIILFVFAYYGLIVPLLPLKKIWPRLWWYTEGVLYHWLASCVSYWGYTAGYDVIEYGDDLKEAIGERCILMANHQSTADVPTLMTALQEKGVPCRKALWVMAGLFKWSPFGLISQVHGDYFVWEGRGEFEIERMKMHMASVFWKRDRRWVLLFPEGGFLYKRKEKSQKYGRENSFPVLEHVALPRVKAFKAILDAIGPLSPTKARSQSSDTALLDEPNLRPINVTNNSKSSTDLNRQDVMHRQTSANPPKLSPISPMSLLKRASSNPNLQLFKDTMGAIREKKYLQETRPPVKYVIDVTIGYLDGVALSADQLWLGTRRYTEDIAVYYKVYKADEIPNESEESVRDWLFARFVEKDSMLAEFYRTGEFQRGEYGRRLHFPLWKIFGHYLFWIVAAFLVYRFYGHVASVIFDYVLHKIGY